MKKAIYVVAGILLLAGCTTHIHDQDDTITAPKTPFDKFTQVIIRPLTSTASENDFPDKAVANVQKDLDKCMADAFAGTTYNPAAPDTEKPTVLIEPAIVDGKKVSTAQRIFFGALAGSSAVLMQVKFTDANSNEIIAQPVFYAKAAAMSGAWTFGAQDNAMLSRLSDNACNYVRQYRH
ncbi:DUF4410 domain-containing protein [Telmatospirillum siberiense]|nr:DUF4410 domain-containing protein [Telmatospirillum siberiense]